MDDFCAFCFIVFVVLLLFVSSCTVTVVYIQNSDYVQVQTEKLDMKRNYVEWNKEIYILHKYTNILDKVEK